VTWLKSRHSNQLVAFDGFNVFCCDRSRAASVSLFVNRSIEATLSYKSTAGFYFEYFLVSFRFKDAPIFVGSIYDHDRLHFDEIGAFFYLLALLSLNFGHLILLADFNLVFYQ
jgi:hypothetical protein